jgi:hypothetical protein
MNSLTDIESAIAQLPSQEARQLFDWLQNYLEDEWDQQIEADAQSGSLDVLIQKAKSDIAAGQVKPLDEILHNS